MNIIVESVTQAYLKPDVGTFKPGDEIRVSQKIIEGNKERIQAFDGIVLALNGKGINRTVTVRKIASGGVAVEKVFFVHSPNVVKITVLRESVVMRRAKLYYLRNRLGKKAEKVKEKRLASTT
jgi:large subunit ribosomal protein L19